MIKVLCSFSLLIALLSSCKPVKYTYKTKDGISQNRKSYTMAGDRHKKKNETTMVLEDFDRNDINKYYQSIDSMAIQEITVTNLQKHFVNYEYTLISIWYPCNNTMIYEVKQFIELVDTLNSLSKTKNIAFVFAGLSYDFHYFDLILKSFDYHFQSYVVPSAYHEKVYLKKLNFIKELNNSNYKIFYDDVSEFTVMLLNNQGEVVRMIEPEISSDGKTRMKDFDKIRNELIELVK